MTSFWGHQDNPFPPEDASVGFDYMGNPSIREIRL